MIPFLGFFKREKEEQTKRNNKREKKRACFSLINYRKTDKGV
jgi:hypothetical protein